MGELYIVAREGLAIFYDFCPYVLFLAGLGIRGSVCVLFFSLLHFFDKNKNKP